MSDVQSFVPRTLKFGLGITTKEAYELMVNYSRCATSAHNAAVKMIEERDSIRKKAEEPLFNEWKLANPAEAEKYDQDLAAYNAYSELRKDCKNNGLPLPDKVEYPKRPKFIQWCLDKWIADNPVDGAAYLAQAEAFSNWKKQSKHSKKYNLPDPPKVEKPFCPKIDLPEMIRYQEVKKVFHKVRDKIDALAADGIGRIPTTNLWSHTIDIELKNVDIAVGAALKRRGNGECASFPRMKPEYAITPITFFPSEIGEIWKIESVEHYDKKNKKTYTLHFLYISTRKKGKDGKSIYLKIRFFPNRNYRVEDIRQIQIGKERGERKWWLSMSVNIPVSNQPLPDKKIGVDINSGKDNHIVVADKDQEIFRMSMPESMVKLDKKINELKRKKASLLKINGNNYKSIEVRKLKKWIRRLHERIANIRNNALHHITKRIVETGTMVAVEGLDVRDMTKSPKNKKNKNGKSWKQISKMNKDLLGVAPGKFRNMLTYKSHGLANSTIIEVNPENTSQRCAECHQKGKRHKTAGRPFECVNPKCLSYGITVDGDTNAARNIVRIAMDGNGNEIHKPIEKKPSFQKMIEAKAKKREDRAKSQEVVSDISDEVEIPENSVAEKCACVV